MPTPMFRLCYLPVNEAWAFVFGDTPVRLDRAAGTLFCCRADALYAALLQGLWVAKDGSVGVVRTAA